MTFSAKIKIEYNSKWNSVAGIFDDEVLPEENITMEIPSSDLNTLQLFKFFSNFLRAIGYNEISIMKGACYTAFNDSHDIETMRKVSEEFDIKLYEDHIDEIRKLEAQIVNLKAKLSRIQNPDNPNYTDEELDALFSQKEITVDKLKRAEVVCKDCGSKYGHYSVGCSSNWTGTCSVCGQEKSVTEVRDWNYLKEGIDKLSK